MTTEATVQPGNADLVDRLVADLVRGQIGSVAFVVPSDVSATLPLYDLAIATVRRGWRIGVEDVHYWFVTPEAEPVSDAASERLEPEGITFIGSTYADVGRSRILLEPQGEIIEADVVVSLAQTGGFEVTRARHDVNLPPAPRGGPGGSRRRAW